MKYIRALAPIDCPGHFHFEPDGVTHAVTEEWVAMFGHLEQRGVIMFVDRPRKAKRNRASKRRAK